MSEDAAELEVDVIRTMVMGLLRLKTESARRRALAFTVDKFFGNDRFLVERLYAGARNTDDTVCADHKLRGCHACWPEVPTP